ncbi:MAG: ABC transporter substrate-binding protein [Pelagibacteraceae bacterium]|jgi:putative spermidine/putrescine transport system substrate-binding protein|nr:ABC transporter substrate-binding protein [Pelagibacteraceae bacterium]MBT3901655.1 ABC transporter substrate-binding protein [Pelagibacteraceae bacterium]MBT4646058.1 ABC transporter substrate-binding protein [Pelagibacteraceae bacterium]MBT4950518.1 ABC transporter substrate-binding protein [Pelagibacteraceae bacterium]MBT5213601.1 ABC transporter substrate-binding protein [Pelagibacteraceae bacterium]
MNNKFKFITFAIISLFFSKLVSAEVAPGFNSWDDVKAAAEGQQVNVYMWGGSDAINSFVDDFYGVPLKNDYSITLNRVGIAGTIDAVNQVLSEKEAGITEDNGSIDLIWINGENFWTLKQAGLLYGPFATGLPNSKYVAWDNPAVNLDFGRSVEGMESPWSSAQFHFIYDSARNNYEDMPRNYGELSNWISNNPGRFTYIKPGKAGFVGTRFIKQIFFELSGGHDQWVGPYNDELYTKWAPKVWRLLNSWEENLHRSGETYPANNADMHALFANGEVDMSFTQSPRGAGPTNSSGTTPLTSRAFSFFKNMIGDFNYWAIPYNAPNKAAALIYADLVLEPILQAAQVQPANGFCCGWGIGTDKVTNLEGIAAIKDAQNNLGDAAEDQGILAKALVSDIAAEYQDKIEADWFANVLLK